MHGPAADGEQALFTLGSDWSPRLAAFVQGARPGTQALGRGPFRHDPPSPLEIEHAIEQVEEAVMPLLRQLPRDTPWETRDAATRQLRRLVHGGGEGRLSIDDVERVFNQLAAVSQGRPVASSGLPPQAAFTAHVLILREAMHHLGFASLTVLSDSA